MAKLIRRAEALKKINLLEEKARAGGDLAGAEWIVKCFNAIMGCRIEDRIYCGECGKKIRVSRMPEQDGGA